MSESTDPAGTVERAALWRALADASRAEGADAVARACDHILEIVGTPDHDEADTALVAASIDAMDRAVPSVLDGGTRAEVLCQLAGGWDLSGESDVAEQLLLAALDAVPGHLDAQLSLAHVRLPGAGYYALLDRLHQFLDPRSYLEIGMGDGSSMALARPGTRAVGVDPVPTLQTPIAAECLVVPQRSEDFLARHDLADVVPGGTPDLVFIDGLHTFPAVLDDLIGVERIAGPDTIVLLHDMIPLDEPTQRPDRVHAFYTGDVWKLLPALRDVRPDLDVATVLTSPSGLTIITGLDRDNRVLPERRESVLADYGHLPFAMAASTRGTTLPDDWSAVASYLVQRGFGSGPGNTALASETNPDL